jgi:fucose 4-O-acetylase-like acetyltransferase
MNKGLQTKKRIGWIDIAKAIGILIVIINHALLDLGVITFLGGMFYMPVFFVLSGYTFKENSKESMHSFITSKAKRLLIPYACFQLFLAGMFTIKNFLQNASTLDVIMPVLGAVYSRNAFYPKAKDVLVYVPKTNIELMTALNAPLWFLTAMFVSLVLYRFILIKANQNKKKEMIDLSICILIGILFKYLCPILLPWSVDTAFISIGFLHVGRILKRNDNFDLLCKRPVFVIFIMIAFVLTSYLNGSVNMSIRDFGISVLLYLIVGSLGTISIMMLAKAIEMNFKYLSKLLEWIGRHTIGILALHLIVFAAINYLFGSIGLAGTTIEKVAKIVLSVVILVPIDGLIQTYLPNVYGLKRRNE